MRVLVGDSHTRSYRNSKCLDAVVFADSGKILNLTSRAQRNYVVRRLLWLRFCIGCVHKLDRVDFVLCLGEPDVRFSVYQGWSVPRQEEVFSTPESAPFKVEEIDETASRYCVMLRVLNGLSLSVAGVVGVHTPNPELWSAASYFNNRMSSITARAGVPFFDVSARVSKQIAAGNFEMVGRSIHDPSVLDYVHINDRLSTEFDNWAQSLGWVCSDSGQSRKRMFARFVSWEPTFGVYTLRRSKRKVGAQ